MIDGSNGFAAGAASISSNRSSNNRRLTLDKQQRPMLRFDEVLRHRAIEKFNQRIVVSRHVQQSARLLMEAELSPAQHLEEFFHGADPAGQSDKAIRQLGA